MPRKKINNYLIDMKSCLGKGNFGQVYKGVDELTKKEIAVKVISKKQIEFEQALKEAYVTQIRIMRKLKSENIVQFYDVVQTPNHYYLIQQYCNGGDLRKRIQQCKVFTEKEVITCLKDVLGGFITLISHGVIHRDMKPQNILINNNRMKIADFGFAKVVLSSSQFNKSLVGTPLYMSPQLLKSQKYTSKCDIWAIGIIVYQLLYGKLPWTGINQSQLFNNIMKSPLVFSDQIKVSQEFKDFITGCLRVEEADRYSWKQVYTHKLFGDIFRPFIQKHDQEERKFKEIMNNFRILVHTNDINLDQIFQELQLNRNSMLSKQILIKIMEKITDGNNIMGELDLIIKKLDDNSDNLVSFQMFQQLLKTYNIQTKTLKKKKNGQFIQVSSQVILDIESAKTVINKLSKKMKQTNVDAQQLYISYAKSLQYSLNFQKFQKLLHKIEKNLSKEQVKFYFQIFDIDKNGEVTFKDFQDALKQFG